MTLRVFCVLICALSLLACESDKSEASADEPTGESSKSKADEASESDDEASADQEKAAAKNEEDDLQSKSCEEFYAYSRDVCLQSLQDGLDVSCYKVLMQAASTREIMAGEGAMAERTKNLSEAQKERTFCGRFYERLSEKVAKAETKDVDRPPTCKEAIAELDKLCLEPMAAGKEHKNGCGTALQTIYRWKDGERFCQLTKDMLLN